MASNIKQINRLDLLKQGNIIAFQYNIEDNSFYHPAVFADMGYNNQICIITWSKNGVETFVCKGDTNVFLLKQQPEQPIDAYNKATTELENQTLGLKDTTCITFVEWCMGKHLQLPTPNDCRLCMEMFAMEQSDDEGDLSDDTETTHGHAESKPSHGDMFYTYTGSTNVDSLTILQDTEGNNIPIGQISKHEVFELIKKNPSSVYRLVPKDDKLKDDEEQKKGASSGRSSEEASVIASLGQLPEGTEQRLEDIKNSDKGCSQMNEYGSKNEIRIVLIGRTGSGKSATANTLIGKNQCVSEVSAASVTSCCLRTEGSWSNKKVVVVDTPGLFDTNMPKDAVTREIMKCIGISAPGLHAVVLVIQVGRMTEQETDTVDHFIKHFGKAVLGFMIIVFTRTDDLDYHNSTLQAYINNAPEKLRLFIEQCGGRCLGFNNRCSQEDTPLQLTLFFSAVEDVVKQNGGKCYSNDIYEAVEEALQQRMRDNEETLIKQRQLDIQKIEELFAKQFEETQKEKLEMEIKFKLMEQNKNKIDNIEKDMQNEFKNQIKLMMWQTSVDNKRQLDLLEKTFTDKMKIRDDELEKLHGNLNRQTSAMCDEKDKLMKQQRRLLEEQVKAEQREKYELQQKYDNQIKALHDNVDKEGYNEIAQKVKALETENAEIQKSLLEGNKKMLHEHQQTIFKMEEILSLYADKLKAENLRKNERDAIILGSVNLITATKRRLGIF